MCLLSQVLHASPSCHLAVKMVAGVAPSKLVPKQKSPNATHVLMGCERCARVCTHWCTLAQVSHAHNIQPPLFISSRHARTHRMSITHGSPSNVGAATLCSIDVCRDSLSWLWSLELLCNRSEARIWNSCIVRSQLRWQPRDVDARQKRSSRHRPEEHRETDWLRRTCIQERSADTHWIHETRGSRQLSTALRHACALVRWSDGGDGHEAWRRLHHACDPRLPGRFAGLLLDIMSHIFHVP